MQKRQFAIVVDSGCDMPKEYLKEREIECVSLGFTMNNINYEGEYGEKISEKEFYQKLREGAMPTTYQVTAETAKMHLEPLLKEGKDAYSNKISSLGGSTILSAAVTSIPTSLQPCF